MHSKSDLDQILHKSLYQFRYTGKESGAISETSPDAASSTLFLAGQSGSAAAVATMALKGSELSQPALIKIFVAEKVTHIYLGSGEMGQRKLFGALTDSDDFVQLFKLNLTEQGKPEQGSLVTGALSPDTRVTGVIPAMHGDTVHLMIETITGDNVFVSYDFSVGAVTRAHPLSGPVGPFMTMLTHVAPKFEVTLVSHMRGSEANTDQEIIFKVDFDEAVEDASECDWELILESMHIAFMEQAGIDFNSENFIDDQDDGQNQSNQNGEFSDFEGRGQGANDGDNESFANSSVRDSSTLGDIRVATSDNEDDDDEEEEGETEDEDGNKISRKSKRSIRRKLRTTRTSARNSRSNRNTNTKRDQVDLDVSDMFGENAGWVNFKSDDDKELSDITFDEDWDFGNRSEGNVQDFRDEFSDPSRRWNRSKRSDKSNWGDITGSSCPSRLDVIADQVYTITDNAI